MSRVALTKLRPGIGLISGLWQKPRPALLNTDFKQRRLRVVDTLIEKANQLPAYRQPSLEDTVVLINHHALETSYTLLKAMCDIGAQAKNIFAIDKHYSRNEAVVEAFNNEGVYNYKCSEQIGLGRFSPTYSGDMTRLWSKIAEHLEKHPYINNILVMDHGGYALESIPTQLLMDKRVIGIEKTTSGFNNQKGRGHLPLPIIDVARCATKKYLEAPLIAEAVISKLLTNMNINLQQERRACGVIGYGVIGRAIADLLSNLGHKVIVYDANPDQLTRINDKKNIHTAKDLATAVNFADLIFGCSGNDITASLEPFELSPTPKTIVSCSSEDREAWRLLQEVQAEKNGKVANKFLDDVIYTNELGIEITIIRGGFPVNFDDSGESVPAADIDLTRSLVLAAVMEAARCFQTKPSNFFSYGSIYALSPEIQQFIKTTWLTHQPSGRFPKNVTDNFEDLDWIRRHTSGNNLGLNFFEGEHTLNEGQLSTQSFDTM